MPSLYEQALEALDYNLVTVEESYTYYNDIMPVQDVKKMEYKSREYREKYHTLYGRRVKKSGGKSACMAS